MLNNLQIKEKYFTFLGILKTLVDSDINTYKLKIDGKDTIGDVFVYSLDEMKLCSILETIKKKDIFHIKAKNNFLQFDVSVKDKPSTLLSTRPYEKGRHILVNDRLFNYKDFFNKSLNWNKKEIIILKCVMFCMDFVLIVNLLSFIGTILYVKQK